MKDYVEENERILEEWCKKFVEDKKEDEAYKGYKVEDYFANDGIKNKGKFYIDEPPYDGVIRRKENKKENELWAECPLRVLFLTKDENTGGNKAWDVRTETFYEKGYGLPPQNKIVSSSFFYQNEASLLYGLLNTSTMEDGMMRYDGFSWEEALSFSDEIIFARINCKKETGGPEISNKILEDAIKEYYNYLKDQILNLDADILVCCGSQNGKNFILNTVYEIYKNEFEYVNCIDGKGTGMHYNSKRNKLAIDAYHLAYRGNGYLEARYNETVGMYYEFLKYLKKEKGIDFTASHRKV